MFIFSSYLNSFHFISYVGDTKDKLWQPNDHSVVCSNHFLATDYKTGLKIKKLKPDALPSVFQDYPPSKRIKLNEPRRVIVRAETKCLKSSNHDNLDEDHGNMNNESCQYSHTSHQLKNDIGVQTKLKINGRSISLQNRKLQTLQMFRQRAKQKISELQKEQKNLKDRVRELEEKVAYYNTNKIESASEEENIKAMFLLEQLRVFSHIKPRWSDATIRYCILWQSKSPAGYKFVRNAHILTLPSKSTLKRYVGSTTGVMVSSLIEKRLHAEAKCS